MDVDATAKAAAKNLKRPNKKMTKKEQEALYKALMKEMQAAMEKGFKQATKAWGGDLPEICQRTLAAANKLFDDYYASKGEVQE